MEEEHRPQIEAALQVMEREMSEMRQFQICSIEECREMDLWQRLPLLRTLGYPLLVVMVEVGSAEDEGEVDSTMNITDHQVEVVRQIPHPHTAGIDRRLHHLLKSLHLDLRQAICLLPQRQSQQLRMRPLYHHLFLLHQNPLKPILPWLQQPRIPQSMVRRIIPFQQLLDHWHQMHLQPPHYLLRLLLPI